MNDMELIAKYATLLEKVEAEITELRDLNNIQPILDFSSRIIDLEFRKMNLKKKIEIELKKSGQIVEIGKPRRK